MKVKVLKRFIDKKTKKVREVGDVFECTSARYAEITKANVTYVEEVTEEPTQNEGDA